MKNNKGFTFIELIVVIIVLGILSVTAVPRYLGLQKEARESVIQNVASALVSGSELIHAKAILKSKEKQNSAKIMHNDKNIPIAFGYPRVRNDSADAIKDLKKWLRINNLSNAGNFTIKKDGKKTVKLEYKNVPNCYVTYENASKNNPPKIKIKTKGC